MRRRIRRIGASVLRAQWSAVFGVIGAFALMLEVVQLVSVPPDVRWPYAGPYWTSVIALIASGAVAATVSAVIQLRTARARFGTFEAVLR